MFFPIGDTPNPPGFRAWVTWLLLAVNVLVYALVSLPLSLVAADPNDPALAAYLDFVTRELPPGVPPEAVLARLSAYDLFVWEHGYKPGAPAVDDLFASMFLHGGVAHLAGNLLFLWIYGDNAEHRLGRVAFLVAYLGTGVAATLSFAWAAGDSMTPLVGASGAISGVLGLYFVMFPRNRVKVLVALFPFFWNVWLVPARLVLGVFLVIDNLLPLFVGARTGVAYGAHIGGFVAGLALAWVGERFAWRPPWTDAAPTGAADGEAALADASRLVAGGHAVAAERLLRRAVDRERDPHTRARLRLALAAVMLRLREPVAAYQQLVAVFDDDPDPPTAAEARRLLLAMGVEARLRPRG